MYLSRTTIEQCKFDVVCVQVAQMLRDPKVDMIEINPRRWIAGRLDLTPDEWETDGGAVADESSEQSKGHTL